jgi:uncharacterized protein
MMILIDTGPLFALFSAQDPDHQACKTILKTIKSPPHTTIPVLTEVCYLMSASHYSINNLAEFIKRGGIQLWSMDIKALERAFILMEQYADCPMDFADASLIVAAESLKTNRIFTLDKQDFSTYRLRKGHHHETVQIIAP